MKNTDMSSPQRNGTVQRSWPHADSGSFHSKTAKLPLDLNFRLHTCTWNTPVCHDLSIPCYSTPVTHTWLCLRWNLTDAVSIHSSKTFVNAWRQASFGGLHSYKRHEARCFPWGLFQRLTLSASRVYINRAIAPSLTYLLKDWWVTPVVSDRRTITCEHRMREGSVESGPVQGNEEPSRFASMIYTYSQTFHT